MILSIFIMVMIVGGFVVLGIICWVFWRAWKRDLAMEKADRIREEAFSMPPERDRLEATPGRPDQATPGNRLVVVATEHSDRFHECIESSVEVRYLCLQIVKVFSTCGLI